MPNRGRPSNPDSPYTMKIHKNGKYRYASTQRIYTNQDGVKTYKHFHWGTLTSDNVFVPNHDFLYLPKSEREKFIFPNDWNFQELSRLQSSVLSSPTCCLCITPEPMELYGFWNGSGNSTGSGKISWLPLHMIRQLSMIS